MTESRASLCPYAVILIICPDASIVCSVVHRSPEAINKLIKTPSFGHIQQPHTFTHKNRKHIFNRNGKTHIKTKFHY